MKYKNTHHNHLIPVWDLLHMVGKNDMVHLSWTTWSLVEKGSLTIVITSISESELVIQVKPTSLIYQWVCDYCGQQLYQECQTKPEMLHAWFIQSSLKEWENIVIEKDNELLIPIHSDNTIHGESIIELLQWLYKPFQYTCSSCAVRIASSKDDRSDDHEWWWINKPVFTL